MSRSDLDRRIAIIGMAGRFPKSDSITTLWKHLAAGRDLIRHFAVDELLAAGVDSLTLRSDNYVRAIGFLDGADLFDSDFFGYSYREAESIDPQQRIFLETAWEALETAGYDPKRISRNVGVFAASSPCTHERRRREDAETFSIGGHLQDILGTHGDHLATRVSFKLNLHGPSMTLQTGCSSSLVAVHVACQSLILEECDAALAGGVSILCPQTTGYVYEQGGISSPDGRCRPFDRRAQGTVRGCGVGIVLLKRLSDALREGDQIRAVILGSALNNDGAAKMTYAAPSVSGQVAAIIGAHRAAGVSAESISLLEAHGTGTALGDPVEVAALTEAFRTSTDAKGFCALGSIKGNIGHLDAAAGVAGLIKTILCLEHKQLVPLANYASANTEIEFSETPFFVNTELRPWSSALLPRRAAVSSFGMGGTNAHVVLEEAATLSLREPTPWHLVCLSAKTPPALLEMGVRLGTHIDANPTALMDDVAFTLDVGRAEFSCRRAFVCRDREDLIAKLDSVALFPAVTDLRSGKAIAFLLSADFPLERNYYWEIFDRLPCFREAIEQCRRLLQPFLPTDVYGDVILPQRTDNGTGGQPKGLIYQLPEKFVIQYAFGKSLQHCGVLPQTIIGDGVGEYTAATLAGLLSLEYALGNIARLAIAVDAARCSDSMRVCSPVSPLRPIIPADVQILDAGKETYLISSSRKSLVALRSRLLEEDIVCHEVQPPIGDGSFPEAALIGYLDGPNENQVSKEPAIPCISCATGTWMTPEQATSTEHWVRCLSSASRWHNAIKVLPSHVSFFVEIGASCRLLSPDEVKKNAFGATIWRSTSCLLGSSFAHWLQMLGELWVGGAPIRRECWHQKETRQRVIIPTYPFQRRQFPDLTEYPRVSRPVARLNEKKLRPKQWLYRMAWVTCQNETASLYEEAGRKTFCWLVYFTPCELATSLVDLLRKAGHEIIVVMMGAHFAQTGPDAFSINPAVASDYRLLLKSLASSGRWPERILHLWSLDDFSTERVPLSDRGGSGYRTFVYLAQALKSSDVNAPISLLVISNGAKEVRATDPLFPAKAMMFGLLTVLPQEQPHICCRCIDVVLPLDTSAQISTFARELAAELCIERPTGIYAFRAGICLAESAAPFSVVPSSQPQLRFRPRGVYVITGGLGRIGLALAEHLGKKLQARLLLLGRSSFPARCEWEEIATRSNHKTEKDEVASTKVRRLLALEKLGAKIMVASVDVADTSRLSELFSAARREFGDIHGVFHSAGIVEGPSLRTLDYLADEDFALQFRSKVEGVNSLCQVIDGLSLDFCILHSSLASILGGIGLGAYAAANAFLDATARVRNRSGRFPWTSLNWDAWNFSDSQDAPVIERMVAQNALKPEEGIEVLELLTQVSCGPQVAVSTTNLKARMARWVSQEGDNPTAGMGALRSRFIAGPGPSHSGASIRPAIVAFWRAQLGCEDIQEADDFLELGGDSLTAIHLLAEVRKQLGIEISLKEFFDHSTFEKFIRLAEARAADKQRV